MVAGAAQTAETSCIKAEILVRILSKTEEKYAWSVEHECIPVGSLLFDTIGGGKSNLETAISLAEAANISMKNELLKKLYTHEHREFQKNNRNDRKLHREKIVS
mgnify:CR=1 FL=1